MLQYVCYLYNNIMYVDKIHAIQPVFSFQNRTLHCGHLYTLAYVQVDFFDSLSVV